MEKIRTVLVADAGDEFRRSFIDSLSGEADIQVVGETGDGAQLLQQVRELQPDVIVMDMVLLETN